MEVHVRLFIQAWRTPLIQALHSSTLVSKNTKKPTRLFLITQKRIQKGVFFALVTMTHARTRPHTDTHIFFGGRGEKQIVFSVVEQICLAYRHRNGCCVFYTGNGELSTLQINRVYFLPLWQSKSEPFLDLTDWPSRCQQHHNIVTQVIVIKKYIKNVDVYTFRHS